MTLDYVLCLILVQNLEKSHFVGIYLFFPASTHSDNQQHHSTTPFDDTPFISNPHSKHLKTDLYQGSADFGEGGRDSDLNRLASVFLRQCTTVTNQC